MKLTIEISDDIIRDAIGGASVSYWCNLARTAWDRDAITLSLTELADGRNTLVEYSHFARALEIMAEKHPDALARLKSHTFDASTGDLLVQIAAFGERKYA